MRLAKAAVGSALGCLLGLHLAHGQMTSKGDTVLSLLAEAHGLTVAAPDPIATRFATFWTVIDGRVLAPQPGLPTGPLTQYRFFQFDNGAFLVEDLKHPISVANYSRMSAEIDEVLNMNEQARQAELARQSNEMMSLNFAETSSLESGSMFGMEALYGPSDLWLEVVSVDFPSQSAFLRLHGTTESNRYQILFTNNVAVPGNSWAMDTPTWGDLGTNQTDWPYFQIGTNQVLFFRAHAADAVVSLYTSVSTGIEPNSVLGTPAQNASFQVSATGLTNDLTVHYRITGTASNGVDYVALSGVAIITNVFGTGATDITIEPSGDSLIEGIETVTLTLIQTNDYLIEPSVSEATVTIQDSATVVSLWVEQPKAVETNGPPGVPAQEGSFGIARYDLNNYAPDMGVFYQVTGTASNGVDYVLLTGVLRLETNVFYTNLVVSPLPDNIVEGSETIRVTLIPTNSYLVDPNSMSGTITNYDSSTAVSLFTSAAVAIEPDGPPGAPGQAAQFTFTRSDWRGLYPAMDVLYSTSGTASNGLDYSLSGVFHFNNGVSSTNLSLMPFADNLLEGTETVTLSLIASNAYVITTDQSSGSATIIDSTTTVSLFGIRNAIEPSPGTTNAVGQTGYFLAVRDDSRQAISNSLTAYYSVSGSATPGVDYTNLPGFITFAPGAISTNIYIQALADRIIEPNETVILTLIPTNTYIANTNPGVIAIQDTLPTNLFVSVLSTNRPVGIDYHAPSNSLIVSYNYPSGVPLNFARVYTNFFLTNGLLATNVVVEPWTFTHGLPDEVKLATVKITGSGFTNGEVFFGTATNRIGKLPVDGSTSNLIWATLTNESQTLRGSLYVDQTGVWNNDVIAVASNSGPNQSPKGIWRVHADGKPQWVTNISTPHLEGVITVPDDTNRWGPWAGKIVTGDETTGKIYTIDINGKVSDPPFSLGINCEDFDFIKPDQKLYLCDEGRNAIFKLNAAIDQSYADALLVTQSGDAFIYPDVDVPMLYFVKRNTSNTGFDVRSITYPGQDLEHVTFAPIDLPEQ